MVGDAPERAQERERILSDCELEKIWRATEDRPLPLRGVVRTLILTGQRRENAAGMRWSELDGGESERLWTIPAARFKTGVVQVIPTDTIAGILGEQPRIVGSDFVFTFSGSKSADVSKESAKLRKLSGVDDWTLHDLRRTAIADWGKLRIDREVRDRLLRIPPPAGVGRTYNRYEFLDEKREALAKWSEHVAGLIAEARSVGLASARRMAPAARVRAIHPGRSTSASGSSPVSPLPSDCGGMSQQFAMPSRLLDGPLLTLALTNHTYIFDIVEEMGFAGWTVWIGLAGLRNSCFWL